MSHIAVFAKNELQIQLDHKTKDTSSSQPEVSDDSLPKPQDLKALKNKLPKNPSAVWVAQAQDLLDQNQAPKALTVLKKVKAPFEDWKYWLTQKAYRKQALAKVKAKRALNLLNQAKHCLIRLELDFPESIFSKLVSSEFAALDLEKAQSLVLQKNFDTALVTFEKAFQRLLDQKSLGSLPAESLKAFETSCHQLHQASSSKKRHPVNNLSKSPENCSVWMQKLYAALKKDRGSAEILTNLAASLEIPTPIEPRFEKESFRMPISYKAPEPDQACFDEAYGLFNQGKMSEAKDVWKKFFDNYPRSVHRSRAKYWQAETLMKLGEEKEGTKNFELLLKEAPLNFYGVLSNLKLAINFTDCLTAAPILSTEIDKTLYPHEMLALEKARNFLAIGSENLAKIELKAIRPRETFSNGFLLYLSQLNALSKNHMGSFSALSELLARGDKAFSIQLLPLIFPTEYWDQIKTIASKLDFDPILALSLMKQESAFEPEIISSAGAKGLMQLMPTTALEVNPNMIGNELFNAENNIETGINYLSQLFKKFQGNIILTLAAYNAGPNAVSRWLKTFPSSGQALEFIETIPYRETREYVGSILRNYYWYSQLLQSNHHYSMSLFWKPWTPAPLKIEGS